MTYSLKKITHTVKKPEQGNKNVPPPPVHPEVVEKLRLKIKGIFEEIKKMEQDLISITKKQEINELRRSIHDLQLEIVKNLKLKIINVKKAIKRLEIKNHHADVMGKEDIKEEIENLSSVETKLEELLKKENRKSRIYKNNIDKIKAEKDSILNYSDFDIKGSISSGGQKGSMRVKHKKNGHIYQLKAPMTKKKWHKMLFSGKFNDAVQYISAGGLDQENFREIIASCITQSILGKQEIPTVSLVYEGGKKKKIWVASRYLHDDVKKNKTLDGFIQEKTSSYPWGKKAKHMALTSGRKSKSMDNDLNLGKVSIDYVAEQKSSIARAIAISALVQDHDVNPGNMVVSPDQSNEKTCKRIDFGHAFGNLIKGLKITGGGIRNKQNHILDFFNRESVSNMKPKYWGKAFKGNPGGHSKLWKHYSGLIPSDELAAAMEYLSDEAADKYKMGLNKARAEFERVIEYLESNDDNEGVQHILKSLEKATEGMPLNNRKKTRPLFKLFSSLFSSKSTKEKLDTVFEKLDTYMEKRVEEMEEATEIMKLQADIDKFIKEKHDSGIDLKNLQTTFLNLSINKRENLFDSIQWIKTNFKKKAFKGNLEDYMRERTKELKLMRFKEIVDEHIEKKTEYESQIEQQKDSSYTYKKFRNDSGKRFKELKEILGKFGPPSEKKALFKNYSASKKKGSKYGDYAAITDILKYVEARDQELKITKLKEDIYEFVKEGGDSNVKEENIKKQFETLSSASQKKAFKGNLEKYINKQTKELLKEQIKALKKKINRIYSNDSPTLPKSREKRTEILKNLEFQMEVKPKKWETLLDYSEPKRWKTVFKKIENCKIEDLKHNYNKACEVMKKLSNKGRQVFENPLARLGSSVVSDESKNNKPCPKHQSVRHEVSYYWRLKYHKSLPFSCESFSI